MAARSYSRVMCGLLWVLVLMIRVATGSATHPSPDGPQSASMNESLLSGSPQCQWTKEDVLKCSLRTLEDTFGTFVSKTAWPLGGNGTSFRKWETPLRNGGQNSLRILEVECNPSLFYQSNISEATFQGLESPAHLKMKNCKIAQIQKNAFLSLSHMRSLLISTHNEEWPTVSLDLQPHSLPKSLEYLNLSSNNIQTFIPGTFCPLLALKSLSLSNNRIQNVEVLAFGRPSSRTTDFVRVVPVQLDYFKDDDTGTRASFLEETLYNSKDTEACCPNLKSLSLDNNDLVKLSPLQMSGLTNLQLLNISKNSIRIISSESFVGLKMLKVLDISHNFIVFLPNGTFKENINLENLHLRNNSLITVHSKIFENLSNLQLLDLSSNHIQLSNFQTDIFVSLRRLVILDMSNNKLTVVKPGYFKGLSSLQRLDLSFNEISLIEDKSFATMPNLYELNLSGNRLISVGQNVLDGLVGLSLLLLGNNSINIIDGNGLKVTSNLKAIDLSVNKFSRIPETLQNMSFLKQLYLNDNNISSIQEVNLIGLDNLITLNLRNNKLEFLSNFTFKPLESLQNLDLSGNHLASLEEDSLSVIQSLRTLNLSFNFLKEMNGLFVKMDNMVDLDLSHNHLTFFDYALLPRRLIKLCISHNNIAKLGNYYKVHTYLNIEELDASHNNISTIEEWSLPDSIRRVYLSNNAIDSIKSAAFRQKSDIELLDIRKNKFIKIDKQVIKPLWMANSSKMFDTLLAGNPLICNCEMEWLLSTAHKETDVTSIDFLPFKIPVIRDLSSLTCELPHVRHNMTVVSRVLDTNLGSYLCPYVAHCFALCQCCDFIACDCRMQCPEACECFHDETWTMNLVDCSSGNLNKLPDKIPMDATVVYLDGNNIQLLDDHQFIGRHSMLHLYLNNSQIEELQNRTFHGLSSLRTLHLQDNMIERLIGIEFSGLEQLRELYLQNNRLSYINNDTFVNLRSLQLLHLENNFIVNFPLWILSENKHLSIISMSNNPWDCNCQFMQAIQEWISISGRIVIEPNEVFCVYEKSGSIGPSIVIPNYSCTEGLSAARHYRFGRQELPLVAGGLCGGVALITALVIVAMVFARRRAGTRAKLGFANATTFCREEDSKIFDAYVSYSAKDAIFVRDVLANKLENGSPSYRLCLHSRDFTESTRLSDFISQSIAFSKKTIIILSKNFITNEWMTPLFRNAHIENLKNKENNVITINYDAISGIALDPELKLIVKKSIKLRWTDKKFWKKLIEYLPSKLHYPGVYVNDHMYKINALNRILSPPPVLPLNTSSSVLTNTTGLATPPENDKLSVSYLHEKGDMYTAPPPPRPCYSPACDYIVMQGRDCRDPECSCLKHHGSAYAFVDGIPNTVQKYNSLNLLAQQLGYPDSESMENSTSSDEQHYSVIDMPVGHSGEKQASTAERHANTKAKIPSFLTSKTRSAESARMNKENRTNYFDTNEGKKGKKLGAIRSSQRCAERFSDYPADQYYEASSGRKPEPPHPDSGVSLTGLNNDECFV